MKTLPFEGDMAKFEAKMCPMLMLGFGEYPRDITMPQFIKKKIICTKYTSFRINFDLNY